MGTPATSPEFFSADLRSCGHGCLPNPPPPRVSCPLSRSLRSSLALPLPSLLTLPGRWRLCPALGTAAAALFPPSPSPRVARPVRRRSPPGVAPSLRVVGLGSGGGPHAMGVLEALSRRCECVRARLPRAPRLASSSLSLTHSLHGGVGAAARGRPSARWCGRTARASGCGGAELPPSCVPAVAKP